MKPTPSTWQVADIPDLPDSFLRDQVEDAAYYRATRFALPGFDAGYLELSAQDGRRIVAPYFTTVFNLGTMLDEGWPKRLMGRIGLRIACVGNPTTAIGRVEGTLDKDAVAAITEHLLSKAPIVCFKGFDSELPAPDFVRARGLPSAVMHFRPADWEASCRSRNLKRKRKKSAALRFEEHEGLPEAHAQRMYELYSMTYERAGTKFGKLTLEYFKQTAGMSISLMAFLGSELVGFAQILRKENTAVASFMGMDYEVNEAHGLYFAIVMRIMDLANELGLTEIEFGETSYTFKRQIGCELIDTWIYYKHRNVLFTALLAQIVGLLEPSEDELR